MPVWILILHKMTALWALSRVAFVGDLIDIPFILSLKFVVIIKIELFLSEFVPT